MNALTQWIHDNLDMIVMTLSVICALLLVSSVILIFYMRRLQKRADRFFGSRSDKRNLENMLAEHKETVGQLSAKYDDILALIDNLNDRMRFCVQKVGVVRYNPFEGMGGDLSFALALLDEHNNGLVLTTIHGRDASYTYTKPIINCESTYTLAEEERQAIDIAVNQNRLVASYHERHYSHT